jgi:ubiquinone/menaquinone biosynthesis C-methylase UbiE
VSTTFFNATPELGLRARCKATWEAGDFGVVAKYNEPVAAEFMSRVPLQRGHRALDVACGTGNLAMIAARAGCVTNGIDIAANLIFQARARAAAEGLQIDFREADAEEVPFGDATFDLVASMFGVMFAPRPGTAAAELLRVCRPGGIIALASWTQSGVVGENFEVVNRHVRAPAGESPLLWGDEQTMRERFGASLKDLQMTRRIARLHYPFPAAQTVDFFRQFYGPTLRAFASLDCARQNRLRADLEQLFVTHNRATDGSTEIEAEYLEVIGFRR